MKSNWSGHSLDLGRVELGPGVGFPEDGGEEFFRTGVLEPALLGLRSQHIKASNKPSVRSTCTDEGKRMRADLGQGGSDGTADDDIVVRVDQKLCLADRGDGRGDGLERGRHGCC
jgi:hypothetical protein